MKMNNRWRKAVAALTVICTMVIGFPGVSLASESISSITLNVESDIMAGDDSSALSVTTTTEHCSVVEWEITNDNGNWKIGDRPVVKITLEADDGYQFKNVKKSTISLKGTKSEVYSGPSAKDSYRTLELKIRLAKLDGSLELENVEWTGTLSPIARWDDDEGAEKYQVRLYRGDSGVGDAITVSQKKYNFASSITREGEYTFRVRAIGNNKKGDWYDSDSLYVSEEDLPKIRSMVQSSASSSTSSSSGTSSSTSSGSSTSGNNGIIIPAGTVGTSGSWQHDGNGWWFRYPDGTYPKGGWLQIGFAWYCFDSTGYMRTGWVRAKNGDYYYCDERPGSGQGALLRDQRTPDGYWVNERGIWVPGA